ncbi:MAG: hypothetical protein NVSMB29_10150 [Candidatus Dormibacteria bacterium]
MEGSHHGTAEGLTFLHQKLAAHFARLRTDRDHYSDRLPIFALEHGLSEADMDLLRGEVCSAVRRNELSVEAWLPFVVYAAAEIGYEYSGDEYWQTLSRGHPIGASGAIVTG